MAGGWSKCFDSETDWNIVTEPMKAVDNRQVKVSRGRFLGGSSGVNGTLCIRGTKQDYDDWGLDEWTGDKMFEYMKRVCVRHSFWGRSALKGQYRPRRSMKKTGTKPTYRYMAPRDPCTSSHTI